MNAAQSLESHFARVGVDPLTAAFDHKAAPTVVRHARAAAPAILPPTGAAAIERVAAPKAAMPAHALRSFESWQAAPENSPARAAIEATLPAHALRALTTLAAAVRETRTWRMTLAGHYWSDRLLHSLQTVLGGAE